jgi:hypothetical protein
MKMTEKTIHKSMRFLAVLALLGIAGLSTNTRAASKTRELNFSNPEKHVQIKVEIHGHIDNHTVNSVEHLVSEWLEAAHFAVSHADGADYLHLHIVLEVTDNHHFKVHSDCADWHEDKEVAVVDAIDQLLHDMINDFIDKYLH